MPSQTFRSAAYALESSQVTIVLLKIDHSAMSAIYVTSDAVQTTHGGNVYQPFPFQIQLLSRVAGEMPVAKLSVDNVHRDLITGIRSVTSPPTVTATIVLASAPNTIEEGPMEMFLTEVDVDESSVTGTLNLEPLLTRPMPPERYTPGSFPGLFG